MTETILTNKKHGMLVLLLTLALYVLAVIGTILFAVEAMVAPMVVCIVYLCLGWIFFLGLKVLALRRPWCSPSSASMWAP